MRIYGAGLAGLLAANVLRKEDKLIVVEKQNSLPNNHNALLRHREKQIGDATGIPFREVVVRKGINYEGKHYTEPTIKLANMYSHKVTGQYSNRSIWNLEPVKRYIAPQDFIGKLGHNVTIQYGVDVNLSTIERYAALKIPQISTIPMPTMMEIVGWSNRPDFEHREIYTFVGHLRNCDVYQTVYYPNPKLEMYRMSITGSRVIAEFIREPEMDIVEYVNHFLDLDFGIGQCVQYLSFTASKYGKIVEIDEKVRRQFIQHMTTTYNLYSLGRYATWRNILLDDVYHDINVIKQLMDSDGYYTGK